MMGVLGLLLACKNALRNRPAENSGKRGVNWLVAIFSLDRFEDKGAKMFFSLLLRDQM
jgi:hypothetical protein